MDKVTIRDFKIGDLAELRADGLKQTGVSYPLHVYEDIIARESGWAYTAIIEGRVIGCAGIISLWTGVGEAWSFLTAEVKHPHFLHRTVKRRLQKIIREKGLHRVQMNVLSGFKKGCRWAEVLGFRSEGILHHYTTDKQNFVRYALWQTR